MGFLTVLTNTSILQRPREDHLIQERQEWMTDWNDRFMVQGQAKMVDQDLTPWCPSYKLVYVPPTLYPP